ncbi:MAG: prolipoprotein diacylglyceryl transferase [Lachnospiraceae bacterium]|nr:prolipoprotein diacylglyceryl transferase [Lachnospiraceae bacterium]
MADRINLVSFPGLGIGEMKLHTVAFTLFGRPVAWYGVIIMVGVILAVLYAISRTKVEKKLFSDLSDKKTPIPDDILDYAIYCVFFGILCARAYYVIMRWDAYYVAGDFVKTLRNCIAIWEGGLAIYGGIIGGVITAFIVSKIKKQNILQVLDIVSPGVMIGQLMGRWGNFVNAEAYGAPTDLPWRMGITEYGVTTCYHPTFLYESLWNLLGFILIHLFYPKKKYHGQIFVMYITWYGFGRMFIEGLRTDSLYVGSIRISQLVGFICFIAGFAILFFKWILSRRKPAAAAETAVSVETGSGETVSSESAETDGSASEVTEHPAPESEDKGESNDESH